MYQHPRASAAQRYLNYGLDEGHMLRTDRGDKKRTAEWEHTRVQDGTSDKRGDDDVDVLIGEDGTQPWNTGKTE